MAKNKISSYLILLYISYSFYLLLGLSWFIYEYMNNNPHHINSVALLLVLVFGVQCYFRHLLTNLILGILALLGSVFMFLEALNSAILASRMGTIMFFDKLLVGITVFSLVMAVVLIFSFMKIGLKEH